MGAIEMIWQDHRRIDELFTEFFQAEPEISQEDLFQQIQTALNAHSDMEEQVLYEQLKPFAKEQVEKSLQEHAKVKQMLADLLDADLNEESFESRFRKVMEDVHHHVEDEESPGGILEIARQHFDDKQLARIAKDMQAIQRRDEEERAA